MSGNSIVFSEEIRILVFLNTLVIWSTVAGYRLNNPTKPGVVKAAIYPLTGYIS